MRDRIHALFMSRQQTVYLFTLMLNCVIYGMLMPTFFMLDIGLGSRVYCLVKSIESIGGIAYGLNIAIYGCVGNMVP